ncbi:MAG: tetratricopeptide repeat protein [Nitrospiria bacterium]
MTKEKLTIVPLPIPKLTERVVFHPPAREIEHSSDAFSTRVKSLVVQESDIREVLKVLFEGSDLNLIIDSDVQGTITQRYQNMTLEEIMESILASNGYLHTSSENILQIGKTGTRVFTMNLSTTGEANAWNSIEEELKNLLSKKGQLILNANAGTIMVTDELKNLQQIEAYIEMVEEAMSRQVLTETKIIEVVLSDTFQFGIDYSLFPSALGLSALGALKDGAVLQQSLSPQGGVLRFGIAKANKFTSLVDLLQTQGQVNVLSSPRIVTLNNMTATIKIADQIPVINRSVIDSGGGIRTEFDISFEQAGISLNVTPKIGSSGEMIITVNPKITEQTGTVTTPDGLQTEPILNVRESSNTIKVRDGESIIIGGFIQNRKTDVTRKIPYLGDFPVINPLFRSIDQKVDKVELIIVLTPKILTNEINRRMLGKGLNRIRQMVRPFKTGILKGTEKENFTQGFIGDQDEREAIPTETIWIEASQRVSIPKKKNQHITKRGMSAHYLIKGGGFLKKGHYAQAIEAYETSLFFDPLDGEAYYKLSLLYEILGDTRKSKSMVEKYLMSGSPTPDRLNKIAMTFSEDGEHGFAAELIEVALQADQGDELLYNNLGVVLQRMGSLGLSQEAFEKSLVLNPGYPEGIYNLALVLEKRKQYKQAIEKYQYFLDSTPFSHQHLYVEGKTHLDKLTQFTREKDEVYLDRYE